MKLDKIRTKILETRVQDIRYKLASISQQLNWIEIEMEAGKRVETKLKRKK